ncbi:MAG: hypothetical protein JXA28_05290 [Bacteroidetes bacterium]|nr:hypothetical protein [Bacteroidota bacterium]
MALDRTSGFDMLVQISENELNNQLATAFLAGGTFPPSISVPVNTGGVVGTADLNFNTPVADLDRPRPRMGITLPFSNSQLQITSPVPLTIAPLGGTIVIVDSIVMVTEGSNQFATMDFNDGAPDVTVVFDAASAALLAPLLAAAGLTIEQAQNMMAGVVLTQLQTSIGRLDLTPPIPVTDDADATTVFDIDVTTVNDTTALDRDCISFGVRMANDSGGNINGVTSCMIPAGSQSLVMMSNFWLLARVMRPRIATSLGRPVTDFDTPLRLNRSIPAPGGQGTLTNLEARVIGNRISVTGRATDSGTGWSAESNFSFFIDLGLSDGAITVTATTPVVDTDVDLAWWVWLASLGLGGLFGGIVGAIVAAVVLAIVEAVAEGIADGMISDGISGSLGGLPAIPLGPIGGGLTLTNVVLDDLELRSTIVRSVSVPVKNQGGHTSFVGFAMDLDSGAITTDTRAGSDLVWNPASMLSTNGSSGLTITGSSFGALTPVQVSRFPLTTTQIPLGLIPFTFPPSFPFLPHNEIVFGVRTTEGRFAKVRAWRSITEGGALHLDWVTFDTPTPSLDIAARWSVLERGEVSEYITPDCSFCRSYPVSRCGIFEAWPRLAAFPIEYQWCLCGEVLEEGSGEVSTANGPLAYRLVGRRLYIETEMAQAVDCELCVSAIDARGMELYTCIRINQSGIEKRCRKCNPRKPNVRIEMAAVEAQLATWRPLLAAREPGSRETVAATKVPA